MWAINLVVVVFPFVPVTAIIGILPVSPCCGNNLSTTGDATFRGNPVVGARCILNPGPALTSSTAPLFSSKGLLISVVIISIPQISRSIILKFFQPWKRLKDAQYQ